MYILHTVLDILEEIIFQHLNWLRIIEAVQKEVRKFDTFQRTKRSTKNGKILEKLADEIPRNKLFADLISPKINIVVGNTIQ